jgi:hypothetical protein
MDFFFRDGARRGVEKELEQREQLRAAANDRVVARQLTAIPIEHTVAERLPHRDAHLRACGAPVIRLLKPAF